MLNPKLLDVWSVSSWSSVILQRHVGQAGIILVAIQGWLKLSEVLIIESCDVDALCLAGVSEAQSSAFFTVL